MKNSLIHKWKLLVLICSDKNLNRAELAVAAHLLNHFNLKTNKCFPSHDLLARETGYSLRHVKTATNKLCKLYFHKKKGNTGWANEYTPLFELIDKDKDVVKYSDQLSAAQTSNQVKSTAPQTINKTIYKLPSENLMKDELEKYVPFVKRGQRATKISDDMVREMRRRQLITEDEFKKW